MYSGHSEESDHSVLRVLSRVLGQHGGRSVKTPGMKTNALRAWKGVIHSDKKLAKKVSQRK